ncbi:probable WRKY transcription factor 3 [Hevea brasiliensis]|uniref:probable WRKY transcription factor 3 n=1 Tax=Hevea brasiliensis TaxID=3981 RepID=UPI0025F2D529|nr:probable WRKY transcription factor 3 [Hevea brasiliensis]
MSEVSPAATEAPMETEEENRQEQDVERGSHRLALPQDGYEWRKYGQKFIKNIGKFRSYFKCRNQNCNARKKVEWSDRQPDNIRIVYEGVHSHSSDHSHSSQPTSSAANQYNLLNQVYGDHQPASQ